MCGIFGYVGTKPESATTILNGLKSLEYRGYDSWGIVVIANGSLKRERHIGKIGDAKTILPKTTTGMGHTRWATHGGVTTANSHPHLDCSRRFAVIHNGIIENEQQLRQELTKQGHVFRSQTDTEVIVHLIEQEAKGFVGDFPSLVRRATGRLQGAFAIGVLDRSHPEEIVLVRFGGPLVVGLTNGYKLFASDPTALLPFTKKVIYLQDRELAWITPQSVDVRTFGNHKMPLAVQTLDWDVKKVQRGGYAHFMLKEIMEQPGSLTDTLRGRIRKDGAVKLGGLESVRNQLRDVEFIRFLACGTASYAGMYGAQVLQRLTDIMAGCGIASEFSYQKENWSNHSAAWFISQSGETADLLKCMEVVEQEKVMSLGLVNVVGSSVARRTQAGVYLHAGPEMAVASTKAFTSQLASLLMISCWLAQNHNSHSNTLSNHVAKQLLKIPQLVRETLKCRWSVRRLAKELKEKSQVYFFGRGLSYPIALEGALKLREVAYMDTIGLPTGELKHGAIAAMDDRRPAIMMIPSDGMEDKNRSSIQELRARGIPVYVVTDQQGRKHFGDIADQLIAVPDSHPFIQPILLAVIVQLLAYEVGVLLKRPIDKPRNLAKSVTVE